jgi:hypothetical protein
MQITETILLIITAGITALSALFCVISLATPRWGGSWGLYCTGCSTASAGLSVVAFILLIVAVLTLVLFALRILPKSIRALSFLILFIATMFTLAAYAAYFDRGTGYSYKLMVVAHFFCYIASLLTTFWLGGSYATTVVTPNNP